MSFQKYPQRNPKSSYKNTRQNKNFFALERGRRPRSMGQNQMNFLRNLTFIGCYPARSRSIHAALGFCNFASLCAERQGAFRRGSLRIMRDLSVRQS